MSELAWENRLKRVGHGPEKRMPGYSARVPLDLIRGLGWAQTDKAKNAARPGLGLADLDEQGVALAFHAGKFTQAGQQFLEAPALHRALLGHAVTGSFREGNDETGTALRTKQTPETAAGAPPLP